jgi:hypothetical protein
MGGSVTSAMTNVTGDGGGVSLDMSSKSMDNEKGEELSLSMTPKSNGDDVHPTDSGDVELGVVARGIASWCA